MNLYEFREYFINEDVETVAISDSKYPEDIFIEQASDILINDYSLLSDISPCYYSFSNGTKAVKNMHIDAASLDLTANCLNLLNAIYNGGAMQTITAEIIKKNIRLMLSFVENSLKGFFKKGELADPAVQLGKEIAKNADEIYKIHLFLVSTDRLSSSVKTLRVEDFEYGAYRYKVEVDILDIERIFQSKQATFAKEDLIIKCEDYGLEGIPCLKAELETDQYDSYLAIVPGKFLADIYKDNSARLLESNVRAFLKFNGAVNKGIRGTILNEKSRFFTYNNGISTTAESVIAEDIPGKGLCLKEFKNLQIINGGQTTATLAMTSIKNHADLSGIYVQMKLTVLREPDPELIKAIANYANQQNAVKKADLSSSHPFYVRMEDYSRKTYAPPKSGELVRTLWFFERTRGQYEVPLFQKNKKQQEDYKRVRPKSQKFTLTDLAKYEQASNMCPYDVAWGGDVCSRNFHGEMNDQWQKNNTPFNDLYYKELVGKKILFDYIGSMISDQEWYRERAAYRPALIGYTFARLVYEAQKENRFINYRMIWDQQSVPNCLDKDICGIAKLVFDVFYDDNRPTANVETYTKRKECWDNVLRREYTLTDDVYAALITKEEKSIIATDAKKEQKKNNAVEDEISIFNKGTDFWNDLITRGKEQNVLTAADILMLEKAIQYCVSLTPLKRSEVNGIIEAETKLRENGIE